MKTTLRRSTLALALMVLSMAAFAQNVIVDTNKTYSGIKKIEVESGWLNVSYKGGAGADVNVKAYLESNYNEQDVVFVTVGDVLKITYTKKQNNYNWNSKNKGHIHITGPEAIALELRGSSGKIAVENVKNESTVLKVSSGSLSATNVEGNLSVRASSGNLQISNISGNVDAGVTSGNAEFNSVRGNVNYQSTSGSLDANDITGEMNVALTSGNAKMNNIGKLGSLRFTSGNMRANNAGLGENTHFNGTSGNFTIQTPSNLKEFNFSLKASSGNLKVGGINTGKTLEMENGNGPWVRGSISSGNITIVN
jgi:lia operon protein LiaG